MHDIEMKDMGEPTQSIENKDKKYYPSISLTIEQLPELEGKEIGDKVSLHIVGLIKGMRKDNKNNSYDIEMRQCGMMGGMSKDEYMSMPDDEKDAKDEKDMMDKSEAKEE